MERNQRTSESLSHVFHSDTLFRVYTVLLLERLLDLAGEPVGFPFKVTGDGVHADGDEGFEGG